MFSKHSPKKSLIEIFKQLKAQQTNHAQTTAGTERVKLQLCECEPATGEPGGLSCDKEGFFVSSFERQGQWVAGGGAVPLSRAMCCRPCLPSSIQDGKEGNVNPVAVVSLGCHRSTDPLGVKCEADGGSFVAGFTEADRVFTSAETLYPVNTAQCCTPSLLLEGGDVWELERCGCHPSDDPSYPVNCGGNGTHDALAGFDYFRLSPMGQIVPVGPATCCGMCLSRSVHPAADCADLNHCSGNGVCLLGRCECLNGWGGGDCSRALGGRGGRIPPWAVALIVIGSCILAMVLLSVAAQIASVIMEAREESDDEMETPLLLRISEDDTGSVGSQDTDDGEEDDGVEGTDVVEERIGTAIQRTMEEGGEEESSVVQESTAVVDEEEAEAEAGSHSSRSEVVSPHPIKPTSYQPGVGTLGGGIGPLAMVDCIVCMVRPVQTVVVPCGHVCMCRRCSRRLRRCPMCRKDILRRQRLFV